jgi:hypothetical protein
MYMSDSGDIKARREKAVKTAIALGLVAAMIFTAFILSGVLKA